MSDIGNLGGSGGGRRKKGDEVDDQPTAKPGAEGSAVGGSDENEESEEEQKRRARYGRFVPSEDNSVEVGDEGYVGVAPEYQNSAYEQERPMKSEDDDVREVEELARQTEDERATANVGFRGYEADLVHPSEREKPQDQYINKNRQILDKQAGS